MELVASKLASKFGELRRRGVVASGTFEVYDLGRTGFVNRRDFREASRQLQLPVTENQLEALMGRFAHQGDGELVSWSEFVTFVSASGVNLPIGEEDLGGVGTSGWGGEDRDKHNGYGGDNTWYDRVTTEPERTSPKRRGGGGDGHGHGHSHSHKGDESSFNDMYNSLRSSGGGSVGGGGKRPGSMADTRGYYSHSQGSVVDHTSKGRSHTEDMSRNREIGRNAVNYLDNQGVSTPKWVRSVLHVEGGGGGGVMTAMMTGWGSGA